MVYCGVPPALYSVKQLLPPTAGAQWSGSRAWPGARREEFWQRFTSMRAANNARLHLITLSAMPVFISGVINGLGPMKAESTKDSFGKLTIFYVWAVNYCGR